MTEIDLTPITRLEYDIDAILNDHAVAEPITRIELILADIVAGNTTTVEPVTRIETYLAIISGADYPVPEPVTRIETFLAIIAGEDYEEPEAVTRLEGLLAEWVEKGSGIWKTVTGTLIHLTDALASPMRKCEVTLEPIQDLHGQDSPYPAGGGKNKFVTEDAVGVSPATSATFGLTITCNSDETITLTGTPTWMDTSDWTERSFRFVSTRAGSYWGDAPVDHDYSGMKYKFFVVSSSSNIKDVGGAGTVDSGGVIPIRLSSKGNQQVSVTVRLMIYDSTETEPTSWSPFANICPITGWTGCEVNRTGVNVWDGEWEVGDYTEDGEPHSFISRIRTKNPIPCLPSTSYYYVTTGILAQFFYYDINDDFISTTSWRGAGAITTPNNCRYIRFYLVGTDPNVGINYPSTDHDYHAYSGTTASVTFPDSTGTVYGGTVDLVSGLLTVDTQFIELDGTETGWTKYGNTDMLNGNLAINTLTTSSAIAGISSHIDSINGILHPQKLTHLNAGRGLQFRKVLTVFGLPNNEVTTWTAFLAEQKANGTPIQIVTYLQTPITHQLTPQQISTLKGVNNVWSNSNGDTTIIYKAQSS